MQSLSDSITALESYAPQSDIHTALVSSASVGWHIDHALLTIIEIVNALKASDPANYRWKPTIAQAAVLVSGRIPRGRAQAPAIVQPRSAITTQSLRQQFIRARASLNVLRGIGVEQYFLHPMLGTMKRKAAERFIQIHTEHHLRIIQDILAKRAEHFRT